MKSLTKTVILISLFVSGIINAQETYNIDKSHATIGFSVSHLVISNVKGRFNDFSGSLVLDAKGKLSSAEATIMVKSIDTENEKRDDHLRNPDFFEVSKFPKITFKSSKVIKRGGKGFLIGKFTIRDVTKILELPYTLKGPINDPWGNKKIGFQANATINRRDFGLTWNKALESGGVVVGDEVELLIDFEANKQK